MITPEQYEIALSRAYDLMDSLPGSEEEKELMNLVDCIEKYENEYYPIPELTLIAQYCWRAEMFFYSKFKEWLINISPKPNIK